MKFQMAEYQRKINYLRTLRSDLNEQRIINEVQKIASHIPNTVIDILNYSIKLAISDKPMQWEKRNDQ